MRYDVGAQNAIYVHLTLLPYIAAAGEVKTKPTQHSVMKLREIGIQPDILLCRTDREISAGDQGQDRACSATSSRAACSPSPDVKSIYELPLELHRQGLDERSRSCSTSGAARPRLEQLGAHRRDGLRSPRSGEVTHRHRRQVRGPQGELQVAQRGAGPRRHRQRRARRRWSSSTRRRSSTQGADKLLGRRATRVLVPGGFGVRGTEGKIAAVRYAREKKMPFFGICLGLQMAVDRVRAQRAAGSQGANSLEFDEQHAAPGGHADGEPGERAGQGRHHAAGRYPCALKPGSLAAQALRRGRDQRAPPPPLRGRTTPTAASSQEAGLRRLRRTTRSSTWWR